MYIKNRHLNSLISLILVFSICLTNVGVALADDSAPPPPTAEPTEPPVEPPLPTVEPTEPVVEPTQPPVEPTIEPTEPTVEPTIEPTEATIEPTQPPIADTPVPTEAPPAEETSGTGEQAPIVDMLNQAPDNTQIVVLDQNGDALPLTSQDALDTILETDPMWCPAGVLPGGPGCTINFGSIGALISNMVSNTASYTQNGIIYFTSVAGGSLTLTTSTLTGGDFNTLSSFNLTLQGGWNGSNGAAATFTGQTDFANNAITIGTSGNPWVGNITLNNFTFSSGDQSQVNIFTTSGNITLSNVDVLNHQNGTAITSINSTSGNITVQNGSTFDGNGSDSQGFFATTGTGSITISDTAFTDVAKPNNATNDSATLSAPNVTLTNVTATGNDGNGITINNANLVTLNNVTASNNGTERGAAGLSGNDGSGVLVNGNAGSSVIIIGGTFNNNQEYGVEVGNPADTTIYIQSNPTCTGNDSNSAPPLGVSSCYNDTTIFDNTPPVITPTITGTAGANGWYTSNVTVSWTVTDSESGIKTSTGCATSNLTSETTGTTLTCSATNNAGLSSSNSVTVKIDKTGPTATLTVIAGTLGSNGWYTSGVTIQTSGTDLISTPVTCTANQFQTTDTAGTVFNGSCTNNAGLTTLATPLTIKLDKTGPTATLTVIAGTAGNNGWYTSDVTVQTSGTDPTSSPVICTANQFQISETAGTVFNGSCTNNAGQTTNAAPLTIKLDKTNPVIAFVSRTPPNVNGWNNSDVTVNWSCTDGLSGPVSASISQTVSTEGANQSATGTCQDMAGNTASDTQSGINIDKTNPTLNLPSDMTVEATSASGALVTYSASASDNLDASPSFNCIPASGSTFVLGTTMVNCTATDHADNVALGNFNITVQDTTGPVIEFHADVTAEATSASGAIVNYTSPATSDAVDGPGVATCSPAPGSTFALGDTTVTCNATDSAGNAASPTNFAVHVVDTTAPVIADHADVTAEATSALGAIVNYTSPATSDAVDGAGTALCSPASDTQFALGDTTVTCNATDTTGNVALPTTFVVHVVDTTAPVIADHADVTVEATSALGAVVTYTSPATSDAVDGASVAICLPASGGTFALGDTTVTCNATDSAGNAAIPTTFVAHVVDTTAPVIAPHLDVTVEATSASGAIVNYTSPATSDAVDGPGVATCSPASGSNFALGDTPVTCDATDANGNSAISTSFVVHVVDTTAPVIAFHADVTAEATSASGAIVNYTSPATSDAVDGPGVATCSRASGSNFILGDTTVTCDATDANGNSAISTAFVVHVVDTTAPVIDPHADINVAATSAAGAVVAYTSPATSDAVDGAGTATCVPPSGNTFPLGNTTVTCNATDSHGNNAIPTTFVVHVIDTAAPVIDGHLDETVEATSAAGAVANYTSPATSDAVDGAGTATCSPASGSFFAFGDTTVTCNATDSNGNAAVPTSFMVHVVDTTAPLIAAHADLTAEATSASGAVVSYSSPSTSDAVDGAGAASCSPASGATFALGNTTVTCNAADSHSNASAPTTFVVHVVDTTAPIIASHADITITTNTNSGMAVTYSSPATSDSVDGPRTASCVPASGSFFPVGNTLVTCNATDAHGNAAQPITFTVTIAYEPLPPSSTPPTSPPDPQSQGNSGFIIPVTGVGSLFDLDCLTVIDFFGIKVTFHNLCDYQATIIQMEADTLPSELPATYSFVQGLNVTVLFDGQVVKRLPVGTGVQLDFPIPANAQDQFAVLLWDDEDGDGKGEWLEVTQLIKDKDLSKTLLAPDSKDELYQIVPTETLKAFYRVLTTDKTATFVLVKK